MKEDQFFAIGAEAVQAMLGLMGSLFSGHAKASISHEVEEHVGRAKRSQAKLEIRKYNVLRIIVVISSRQMKYFDKFRFSI